ncbi:hypothetical protein SAMN02982917_4136 [Azospirillum oryzae]|uniref:Uncharacterized protein n=1 Tax=Azospirillum oryzae TaxID=286727 RepID=A0A1X7GQ59_9PROT|nr:hypothetical protein SAMN02982917_4136 [Azospirillum oryzae]
MPLRMICTGILLAWLGGCVAFLPIYTSRANMLTYATAEQMPAHNLAGAHLCG